MKKISLIFLIILGSLSSCSNVFNQLVLPNQCKKCEVINLRNNEILFSKQGCGSDNTNLEEQAKIKAYDLSRSNNLCDLEVHCQSWRKTAQK